MQNRWNDADAAALDGLDRRMARSPGIDPAPIRRAIALARLLRRPRALLGGRERLSRGSWSKCTMSPMPGAGRCGRSWS